MAKNRRESAGLTLAGLVPLLAGSGQLSQVIQALERGQRASIDGAWGSASALVTATLAKGESSPTGTASEPVILVVKPRISEVDDFALDLAGFLGETPLIFPAWETVPDTHSPQDPIFSGRLSVLQELWSPATKAIAAPGTKSPGGKTAPGTLSSGGRTSAGSPAAGSTSSGSPAGGAGGSPLSRFRKTKPAGADETASLKQPAATESNGAGAGTLPHRKRRVIVTSFPALLQPIPSQQAVAASSRTLRVGETLDPTELLRWLVERGFERVAAIELRGEFCMHGGIVDIFPPADVQPLRIEFFGDEIESIRRFDVETQRKTDDLREVSLTVFGLVRKERDESEGGLADAGFGLAEDEEGANDVSSGASPQAARLPRSSRAAVASDDSSEAGVLAESHLLEALPAGSWVVLTEVPELVEEGRHFLSRLDNPRGFFGIEATLAKCQQFPVATLSALSADEGDVACHLQIESVSRFDVSAHQVVHELANVVSQGERVLIACHNAGEKQRLSELLAEEQLAESGQVTLCEGFALRGFRLVSERLSVLSDHELYGRRDIRRVVAPAKKRAQFETRAIESFLELGQGDLVVHLTHGIARYRGMQVLQKGEQEEEHLVLEFREQAKIYVPVSLIHLVQKYIGGAKSTPELSKIGSNSWEKKKKAVAEAVQDLASDMIELQAQREQQIGISFPPDSHWQDEFEAAFGYPATPDQVVSISAIKDDMQRPRPMDRLLCGDVGYGKTEVAMRAAFKALDAGKQVAVLVPTTVLAEQHFRTFSERMAEYPFNIDVISRFRTKGEQREILEGLKEGQIDLIIGTHRIVQPDIQFKDLGLLVIDEEQRFGVEAKEQLKKLRLQVDVLTMSATPIPRTLHLSLLGIRDISNLQTPPQDRQAIETRVSRWDGGIIRQAIVRELNRGGQVYFVHNRIYNILEIVEKLKQIVPEARIGIVHGQMTEHELEEGMLAFVNGHLDILVATTIIESGLDIPNANTIFIHQADKYGLAELHQLRGRVGRYKHRAYCYLLLEEGRTLTTTAARRLKAIEEFSELGAGFKIAMRDLEIRGAGNILGTEQSGHIATVGYELYCQLLENAVRQKKKMPLREVIQVNIDLPIAAYLPDHFVPPGRHKVEVYRKLSRVENMAQWSELQDELRDRFGPLPDVVENLFEIRRLQLLAQFWQIDDIHLEEGFVVFKYRQAGKIRALAHLSGSRLRIVDDRNAYLPIPGQFTETYQTLALIKALLQPNEPQE